ncbi:ATP-binding protein, partial [uncultured Flavobacterium sp.]|uniref:sensor histidine kinase n=1 Tax=uncultured Flavobacterium sp. TaxID=165435 RepID=UPI0030CA3708
VLVESYQIKSVLYRIVQEFLQNSIKHSKCENIFISLQKKDNSIQLQLQDDGIGFDLKKLKTNGIGLHNIKKRTEILGGTFELESKTNFGTKLTILIPL